MTKWQIATRQLHGESQHTTKLFVGLPYIIILYQQRKVSMNLLNINTTQAGK